MEAIICHRQITLVFDFVLTPNDRPNDFGSFRSSLMLIQSHRREKRWQFEAFQCDFLAEILKINYVKPTYVPIRAIIDRKNSEVLSSVKSKCKSITKL